MRTVWLFALFAVFAGCGSASSQGSTHGDAGDAQAGDAKTLEAGRDSGKPDGRGSGSGSGGRDSGASGTDSGAGGADSGGPDSSTTGPIPLGAGTTWYVRKDGGTRYSASATSGQCDGKHDAAYPGSGVNQPCAFGDFRFLYDDQHSNNQLTWAIAGGDTVVVRDGPWRIGWDNNSGSGQPWCAGLSDGNSGCFNPTIPAGRAGQHTRILSSCAVAGTCATGNTTHRASLTQLFGGFSAHSVLNLAGAKYLDLVGFELTTHNGQCVVTGSPAYPAQCSANVPSSDYDLNGIASDTGTSNILLQDLDIHGHSNAGLQGPIGGPITMNRVFVGFNGFAGWNFDDGKDTPDGPGSSIDAHYVTMEGNGCNEEYPIVHTAFPALSCYDLKSGGFGDSWSGQDTNLDSFTCDHCIQAYNTKDGFIGPHVLIGKLTITDSLSYGNMGEQWKWGMAPNSTLVFTNSLAIGNCDRLAEQLPGAVASFNQTNAGTYGGAQLTDYCRAAGDVFSFYSAPGGTVLFGNNTVIAYNAVIFDLGCQMSGGCGGVKYVFENNLYLGYINHDPVYASLGNGEAPTVYYANDSSVVWQGKNNLDFGVRNGDTCGGTILCSDPALASEPAGATINSESALDNFDFYPSKGSPVAGAGTTYPGLASTDYYGTPTTAPPVIGAVNAKTN